MHIRYLVADDGILPNEVLKDFMRLFPDTPFFPRVRSLTTLMDSSASCLPYFIRSSTPADTQPSASASALRRLFIYRSSCFSPPEEEGESLARDLAAFQRSNGKLRGGLEAFQDFLPFPARGRRQFSPAGCKFQESIENAFALALTLPETMGPSAHGLHRLEVTHYLHELPAFFGRVTKMRALEHLKIAIAHEDDVWEPEEEESDSSETQVIRKPPPRTQRPSYEGIQHSASSLEIEAIWDELSPTIHLCAPPSVATQLRTLRLLYYLEDLPPTHAASVQVLDLPADIIPPVHLEALTINLLDNGEDIPNCVDEVIGSALQVDAFRPLLRYRQMVNLHLELPCNVLLDIEFLHALGAAMGETLRHFVILRRLTQESTDEFKPALTAADLPTIVGATMPRLETLGLDVGYNEISVSAKWESSVPSSLLQTLYVGMVCLSEAQVSPVARFLKEHFPGLEYLYHHEGNEDESPWQHIVNSNGYSDGNPTRRDGLPWGYY